MPFIQNVSMSAVRSGHHQDPGNNAVLIQIVDLDTDWPKEHYDYDTIYRFRFLDAEVKDAVPDNQKINAGQAKSITDALTTALEFGHNVIVHCHAGICRSGAVCEVGIMMGFEDTGVFRSPNLMVKHALMKQMGWLYDEQEEHSFNGYETTNGVVVPPQLVSWENDNEKVFALAAARKQRREQTGE
jgi:predicted protein tyrosine phosphatase